MYEHWSMLFISPSVYELTGYRAEEFTEQRITFAELIVKEDRSARAGSGATEAVPSQSVR